jgi:hypothetical protein
MVWGALKAAVCGTGTAVATTAAAIKGLSSIENFRRSPALELIDSSPPRRWVAAELRS